MAMPTLPPKPIEHTHATGTTGQSNGICPTPVEMLALKIMDSQSPNGILRSIPAAHFRLHYDFHDVYTFEYHSGLRPYIHSPGHLVAVMPLHTLLQMFPYLDLKDLRRLCYTHMILFHLKTKSQLLTLLKDHSCVRLCGSVHVVVFKCRPFPRTRLHSAQLGNSQQIPVHFPPSSRHFESEGSVPQGEIHRASQALNTIDDSPEPLLPGRVDDESHLELLTDAEKLSILDEWESLMSAGPLTQGVCASCSGVRQSSEMKKVDARKINLELLKNPDLDVKLLPNTYSTEAYSGAILDPAGMDNHHELGTLHLCRQCHNALNQDKIPRFSLANHLYYAREKLPDDVKTAFQQSSLFERMLICRARFNTVSCQYNGTGYNAGTGDPHLTAPSHSAASELSQARKGAKGNLLVVPTDSIRLHRVIPPSLSSIKDTMCVVFVGTEKPTLESIKAKHKSPILVRRARVKTMIEFLTECNRCYIPSNEFAFSSANLDLLLPPGEEEGVMPSLEIGHLSKTKGMEGLTADYTPRGEQQNIPDAQDHLVFENVGYTDGDTGPANYHAMKYMAMERCRRGMPFLLSGTGNSPVPDFNNPNLLTWLFPHLDPWGIGGFLHPNRRVKISIEQQLRHLLTSSDRLFEQDEQFAFVFYNIIRKIRVARSIRFSVSPKMHRSLTTAILMINPDTLADMASKFKKDPWYTPTSDEEKRVSRVMSSVTMASHQIPGSDGHKLILRNQIRALINYQGTPTLFLTINPADVENPIVRLIAGDNVDLDDFTGDDTLDSWRRRMFAAKHPAACALFFDMVINQFIKTGLCYDRKARRRGIFGICSAYYGTVEAQGKGTLHCHMLVWLDGHLPPHELRAAMLGSTEYKEKVFRWVESVIKCEFPDRRSVLPVPDPIGSVQPSKRRRYFEEGNPHPGTVASPSVRIAHNSSTGAFWYEFDQHLSQLLHEYHWHVHNMTCWKYLRKGEKATDATCRLRMDGVTRERSSIHPETGELFLRRHHPYLASYNDLVTFMLKCNSELKFIGSGKAARDLVHYITDYVTKPNLPVHAGMAALQYALQKIGKLVSSSIDGRTKSVNASSVVAAVNSMMGRHEISHPQVMSYLVGGGDHYTSHMFAVLNWGATIAFVDQCMAAGRGASDYDMTQHDSSPSNNENAYTLDVRGESVTTSSQQLDYVYRNTEAYFENLCLYDFISLTKKEVIPKQLLKDDNIERVAGSFSSWEHQQRSTHRLASRATPHVPVLLGPSIPNPKRSAQSEELWAKHVTILFIPWRDPNVLMEGYTTWLEAFKARSETLTTRHTRIIENLNAFSASSDERAAAPPPRKRAREGNDDDNSFDLGETQFDYGINGVAVEEDSSDVESPAVELSNPYLSFKDTAESRIALDQYISRRIGPEIVPLLNYCHQIPEVEDMTDAPPSHDVQMSTVEHIPLLAEHQALMRGIRQKRGTEGSNQAVATRTRQVKSQWDIQPRLEVSTLANKSMPSADPSPSAVSPYQIAEEVINRMNLASNREQLRAFNIVASHLIDSNPNQLLMYVSGVGGTGKSHVIKSIVSLFQELRRENELLLGAPTGIAAVLINGQTLHSLAFINSNGRSGRNPALISTWKDAKYLIIDEVSMVGAKFLSQFSNRLREAKMGYHEDVSLPFGGVNVIFMGDFGQLKPPVQHSLYAHAVTREPSFRTSTSVDGISASNGIILWRQVKIAVELQKNQRHAMDPEYSAFLLRLRSGLCRPPSPSYPWDDLQYLKSRLLINLSKEELMKFKDAPIIVGSKATRDALNAKLIAYNAFHKNEQVHLYHSADSINKSSIPLGLRNKIWNIESSKTQEALGRLPLFVGMKVMVTENIAFATGIVNGSEGVVEKIQFNEDGYGFRTAVVAYVRVEGCGMTLPGLEKDVVPIFPVNTSIQYPFFINGDVQCKSFSRRQLPLVPAYAYTDFKSQGRSLDLAFVDLATARGQGVYVMLSRVRSLQGVVILRWFHPAKIYSRLSAELREEMDRIHGLVSSSNSTFH